MQITHLGKDSYGELCSGCGKGVPVKHTLLAILPTSLFLSNRKETETATNNSYRKLSVSKL